MIAGLKPYPTMKPSGVEWLGDVPEQWELRRTKTLLRERVEKGSIDEPLLAATQSKGVVRKDQYENRTVLALKDLHLLKLVRVEDFVISLRSFQGGIEYAREQGIISPAYTVLFPSHPETHGYLARLFKSKPYVENLSLYVTGIRQGQNIDYTKLARSLLPSPPLDEQAAIVRYLDHVDRRISGYIRAKQRLIELLEEEKQAIIHGAVTRGLDSHVPLKPSGMEWLGDAPEHWEVAKIKQLARPGYRSFVDGDWIESPYITTDGIRLIQTGNIGIGEYREKGFRFISEETLNGFGCTEFEPGDVLICRLGEPVARACLAPQLGRRMITSVDVCILKLRDDIEAQFVVYAMSSRRYLDWVSSLVRGSTRDRVSRAMLGSFSIPLPSLSEQSAIVSYLDVETSVVGATIARARREIELLNEYRTRLIADVVTGKLDVREAAAALPKVDTADLEEIIEIDDVTVDELALELEEVAP